MKTLLQTDPNLPTIQERESTPFSHHVGDVLNDPGILTRGLTYGSVIGTTIDYLSGKSYEPEQDYDPYQDPRLFNYRKFIPEYFANSVSAKETTDRLADFKQYLTDLNNPMYHIGHLLGEFSDPSNWVFGSALIKGAKTAQKFGEAGREMTKFAKLMTAEELTKQALNENRPIEDALVVGGFAWYINRLGKKFINYEDGAKIFEEMKFYENASDTEIPPIAIGTKDPRPVKQPKNVDDAIIQIKSEYPDMTINRGRGVGKTVNGRYVPAFVRRNPDLSVAELNLDDEGIIQMFRDGRHLKSTVPGVKPFKKGDFENEGEWLEFVIRHELAHVRIPKDKGESKAEYENRINEIAYNQILENREGKVVRQGSVLVDQQKIQHALKLAQRKYRNKIDPNITDDQLKTIPTGYYIEKLGYNPIDRVMNQDNRVAKEFTLNLLKNSLYLDMNRLAAGLMPDSAEVIKAVDYNPLLFNFTQELRDQYKLYLKENGVNKYDFTKKAEIAIGKHDEIITFSQFRDQVTLAILRGYKHTIPQVEASARFYTRAFTDPIGNKIDQYQLFLIKPDKEYQFFKSALDSLADFQNPKSQLYNPTKKYTYTYPRTGKKVSYTYKELEEKVKSIEDLIKNVKSSAKRKNYFTVMWNFEMIEKNFDVFYKDVYPLVYRNTKDKKQTDNIMENFKNYKPYEEGDEFMDGVLPGDEFIFKKTSYSKYIRSRTIPLKDLDYEFLMEKGYIAKDIEFIATQYFKNIVPDIILTEKYGDPFGFGYMNDLVPDMFAPGLRQIAESFDKRIYNDKGEVINEPLRLKRNKVLRDTEAMRDLFKGRYGLSKNPQRALSRTYRIIKPLVSMELLTGALAGIPDIARIITYNGFKKAMPRLMQYLSKSIDGTVREMGKKQANRPGQAIEFMLDSGRANQIYGSHHDTFATFNRLDRAVQSLSSFNFKFINQMATWTQEAKIAASIDAGTEIIEASMRLVNGTATELDRLRFNHAGISLNDAKEIVKAYKKYGSGEGGVEFNDAYSLLKFANTDKWIETPEEVNAAFRFNRALNETVDNIVVTPTLGDTPLWTSKELGAVISQYKKFMFAFDRKVLQRGLQERDAGFLGQIAALLFFGMLVDGIRSGQLNKDYSKKDIRDKIYDGFERSGAGGLFLEVNRMVETLTDNKVGVRPMIGVGKPYGTSLAWKTGVLGPAASQMATVAQIMYDWGRGKHTHHTARRIRKLVPFNNIWYLDSIFDKFEKKIR